MSSLFVEVAVDAPIGPCRKLDYSIPLQWDPRPGQMVWVPLSSRWVSGIIFSVKSFSPVIGIRPVEGIQNPDPLLSDQQLDLAEWISWETHCSVFEAASVMLPIEYKDKISATIRLNEQEFNATPGKLSANSESIIQHLTLQGPQDQKNLLRAAGTQRALDSLVQQGLVIRDYYWKQPKIGPRLIGILSASEHAIKLSKVSPGSIEIQSERQIELLRYLIDIGPMKLAEARQRFGPYPPKMLVTRNLARVDWSRSIRDPLEGYVFPEEEALTLTPDQKQAIKEINAAQESDSFGRKFLLHGVTGSGKTEVYLQALTQCIQHGKRALYLVPEITLTSQTIDRLGSRFPGRVALWHSRLTPGQRYDTWWRIQRGEFDIVLGSRSAIFTPLTPLGLIIIDEEHEWTYKQEEQAPRYHVRDVALRLTEQSKCVVVLGGATPDITTYYNALKGNLKLLQLPDRLAINGQGQPLAGKLATVEVIDMRAELKSGVRGIFSRALYKALQATIDSNEQAILFLNRRGAARIVQCRNCGHVLVCRRCQIPMTYHSEGNRVLCHYCGNQGTSFRTCPACKSERIRYLGIGTQQVAEEVSAAFGVNVIRWDRDASRDDGLRDGKLQAFAEGKAQVLVGTQLIAKGLHFPNVTLVAAVLADQGLQLPDFRSSEFSFQLLCQLAGRSGRGHQHGRGIIQTYLPEHYAILTASSQMYEQFYEEEIAYRWAYINPPFSRLCRLLFEHSNPIHARRESTRLASVCRKIFRSRGFTEIQVIGPAPAYPPRLIGKSRWQIILRVPQGSPITVPELLHLIPSLNNWKVTIDPMRLV